MTQSVGDINDGYNKYHHAKNYQGKYDTFHVIVGLCKGMTENDFGGVTNICNQAMVPARH